MNPSTSASSGGFRIRASVPVLALVLALALPAAQAGTPEAPELTDPVGDCEFVPANHWADIVAGWISDETAMDFRVNLRLAEWIADQAGSYAAFTVQFTHQGVQWGVTALFDPSAGWEFSTAFIDLETGEMSGFNDTEGSFDPATATMSIVFPKALFPHEGSDDKLAGITAASVDFKTMLPFFAVQGAGAPVSPPLPLALCDLAETSATYTFAVGQHTMHSSATTADAANATEEAAAAEELEPLATRAEAQPGDEAKGVPGSGAAALVGVLSLFALLRRSR